MKIDYTCKCCHVPKILEMEEVAPEIKVQMKWDVWLAMLTCNRCADFETKRRKLERVIANICFKLRGLRASDLEPGNLDTAENAVRNKLIVLTKKFAALVCDFNLVTFVWEPEFADSLMRVPEKTWLPLHFYLKQIRGFKQIKQAAGM